MATAVEEVTPERPTAPAEEPEIAATPNNTMVVATTTEMALVETTSAPTIPAHIEKVYRDSETRTPIIVMNGPTDDDPYPAVVELARQHGCCVWKIVMDSAKNEQNAIDYVDVGIRNGDWVYLTSLATATTDTLRLLAKELIALTPEPKTYPRRQFFRLWLEAPGRFNVNDHIKPLLPQLMMQNALVAVPGTPAGASTDKPSGSPRKTVRRLPAEVPVLEEAVKKHAVRRDVGRDSDSESDMDEPEKKVTGLWFHRAVDFFEGDAGTVVARVKEIIFEVVEKQDVAEIEELCNSGRLDVNKVKNPDGMTPLQFAVSRERVESVKALLACGADPTIRRETDNSPLLFMCIESEEILTALIEGGADIHERFQGFRLEDHPTTQPHIAALVRDLKGLDAKPKA